MNTLRVWVCFLSVGSLALPSATAQTVSSKPDAQGYFTLFDPRLDGPSRARFSSQEQKQIVRLAQSATSRGHFAADAETEVDISCTPENFSLDERVQGSFTRSSVKETAYLYRNCMMGSSYLGSGIVVYRGAQVVAHATLTPGFDMRVLPDLNRNGRNEILLVDLNMHMGYEEEMVQILEWNGPRLSRLGAWQVMDGDCTGSQSRHSLTVLKVKPGQPFKILGDVYKGNCKTDKRVSSGKAVPPFELYSPEIFAAPINGN